MEFYELNRLYDENLAYLPVSKLIDRYLFILMPVLISFGCVVSSVNLMVLSRPYFRPPPASKSYLYSQSVFQLLFQLCTTLIFFLNYYESTLIDALNLNSVVDFLVQRLDRVAYYKLKLLINIIYNIVLYCSIWLFVIDTLDYCLIAIVKFHFNLNFNRIYKKLFQKQQARVYQQQKMIKDRLKIGTNSQHSPTRTALKSTSQANHTSYAVEFNTNPSHHPSSLKHQSTLPSPPLSPPSHHQHHTHFNMSEKPRGGVNQASNIMGTTTNSSSTSSYSYTNPNNGTIEEYLIETHLIDPSVHELQRPPPISAQLSSTSSMGGVGVAMARERVRPQLSKMTTTISENDPFYLTTPDDATTPGLGHLGRFMSTNDEDASTMLDDDDNMDAMFFDKKTLKRREKQRNKQRQLDHLDEDEKVIFCTNKQILYAIGSTVFVAFILVFPQFFGFEVKQTFLSISPSVLPDILAPTTSSPLDGSSSGQVFRGYENVYFIEDDETRVDEFGQSFSKRWKIERYLAMRNLSYTNTMYKAMGMWMRVVMTSNKSKDVFYQMARTHASFFSFREYFRLASNQYDYCNLLKNSIIEPKPQSNKITLLKSTSKNKKNKTSSSAYSYTTTTTTTQAPTPERPQVDILTLSLTCIKKSELNNDLSYNTLYFWLEHTMVISVPICIAVVVLVSLVYMFLHFTKLLQYQDKLKHKYKKLCEQQKQYERMNAKKQHTTGVGSGANLQEEEQMNEKRLILNNEKAIRQKQIETQYMNEMYIIDLVLYLVLTFPYTVMRLVLDLFVKDQIKISLDFYIFYQITFMGMHMHLIIKFILMCVFNMKYRASMAKCFSFLRIPMCCITQQADQSYRFLCCLIVPNQPANPAEQLNGSVLTLKNFDHKIVRDDDCFHSTEFNSDLHKYARPADPDELE